MHILRCVVTLWHNCLTNSVRSVIHPNVSISHELNYIPADICHRVYHISCIQINIYCNHKLLFCGMCGGKPPRRPTTDPGEVSKAAASNREYFIEISQGRARRRATVSIPNPPQRPNSGNIKFVFIGAHTLLRTGTYRTHKTRLPSCVYCPLISYSP